MRAFLHVNDVCSALSLVLSNGKIGEIYNIGSDEHDEYTVLQVANMLIRKIQYPNADKDVDLDINKWITYIKDRPFNDKRYYISNDKVKQLGWTINTKFEDGIDELIRKN